MAYKRGSFPALPEGLSDADFRAAVEGSIADAPVQLLLIAQANGKPVPVGFLGARAFDHRLEPHIEWFKWATPRQKLECAAAFLEGHKPFLVIAGVRENGVTLFRHLALRGLMREVGTISNYYGPEKHQVLFQSV